MSKVNVLYKNEIDFPVISICRANPFSTEFSKEILIKNLENNGFDIKGFNYTGSLSALKLKYISKNNNALLSASNTPENIRRKFGSNLKDVIVSCIYNNQECNFEEDFEDYFDYCMILILI